jgi:hypothetical protein
MAGAVVSSFKGGKTMTRVTILTALAAAFVLSGAAHVGAQTTFEINVDRPGLDYANFDLPQAQARDCQQACLNERQCSAWTYVRPGYQGPAARCWLKYNIPQSVPSDCCVSGVVQ